MSSENLAEAQRYWENDSALMDTLIQGLVSPSFAATLKEDILKNPQSFGLGAYDASPDAPPQYLGGRLAMHLRRSKEIYVDGWVRNKAAESRKLLCEQYSYCTKRQDMDGVTLAATIADTLFVTATNIPIPVASIAVYLVKKKILDELCGCDATKAAEEVSDAAAQRKRKSRSRKSSEGHRSA
jgi:hypothetical protein